MTSITTIANGWGAGVSGGLDRYAHEVARRWATEPDTQVEYFAIGDPAGTPAPGLIRTSLAPDASPTLARLWMMRRRFARRVIRTPDAVALHFALTALPLVDQLPTDAPVTFFFHGPWASESRREHAHPAKVTAQRLVERYVHRRSHRFVVLSDAFGHILQQQYNVSGKRITKVPGGVDTARFRCDTSRSDARRQLGWPVDRFVAFTPRRLVRRVGVEVLLDAIADVRRVHADVWLAVAGHGPLRAPLERHARDQGLWDAVRFVGHLPEDELPIAYQAADVTVVPSQFLEGFGLVVVESLASGTPVVCTPVGGMPEVLARVSPQLITEGLDHRALARLVRAIITGRVRLPSRGACRQHAVDHYDWGTISRRALDVVLPQPVTVP